MTTHDSDPIRLRRTDTGASVSLDASASASPATITFAIPRADEVTQDYTVQLRPCPSTVVDSSQKGEWYRQEAFLAVFSRCGKVGVAARTIGIDRSTVYAWADRDALGFRERKGEALDDYREYLESLAQERVEHPTFNGRIGSDVLLIALNNANNPEKWRPNVHVTHDLGKRVMETLAALQAKDRAAGVGWGATAPEPGPGIVEQASAAAPDREG